MLPLLNTILGLLSKFLEIFKKYPWQVLFVLSLVAMFFMDTCRQPCPDIPEYPTEIDTVWVKGDSISYPDTVYVPKHFTHYKDTGSTHTIEIPADIDSLAIALAFFTEWEVIDTILFDSNGVVIIADLLRENRIQNREVFKKFYPSYIYITKPVPVPAEPKSILLAGGGVTGNQHSTGFSIGAGLINKRQRVITVSWDLLREEADIKVFIPIRFSK